MSMTSGSGNGAAAVAGTGAVFVAGATGYIGRAVVPELLRRGRRVVAFTRARAGIGGALGPAQIERRLAGAEVRYGDVTDPDSLAREGLRGERFDAFVSCLASRTGGRADAWRIDYEANRNLLSAAATAGARQFVLLSAICVQRPRLAFQHAKLAFEAELARAELDYAIVRPTAFFKSIAGQVPRVRRGKPYIVFGHGEGPLCQPISERDLAAFMADCLEQPDKRNRILPVGGPGPAVSALERGEMLFELAGLRPRYKRLPVAMFDAMIPVLEAMGRLSPRLADKAEFARIGRYYATESMVWLDPATGEYDPAATPAYGEDTLRAFYAQALKDGLAGQELGDQALF